MVLVHGERDPGPAVLRRRRVLYGVTSAVLAGVMLLAVADAVTPTLGVDSATVTAEAPDGTELRVQYTSLTRPALASPFAIEVTRAGGFQAPIELAISRPWIEVWDENGMYPTPSAETADDEWVIYEFDPPPDGDTFRFFYDARLEPARQAGVDGAVELRSDGGTVATVELRTRVRP